jgi:hypothetical protein
MPLLFVRITEIMWSFVILSVSAREFSPSTKTLILHEVGFSKAAVMKRSMSDSVERKSTRQTSSRTSTSSGRKREVMRTFTRDEGDDCNKFKMSDRTAGCSSSSPSSTITGVLCAEPFNLSSHDSSCALLGFKLLPLQQLRR